MAVMRWVHAAGEEWINLFCAVDVGCGKPLPLSPQSVLIVDVERRGQCWKQKSFRARLLSPEPSRLRTIACENCVVALVGATQNTPSCPDPGPCISSLSPGPQGRHHLHTAEEPRAHWGVWEGPLRGRSGVPRPAVWIHGTWPTFPNFPLATTSTTRVLPSNPALLTSPPSRHSTLTVHPPPPPLHLEDILPATYPSLSGSSPGRHMVGPGPSRHVCLGTRDGSSPTPRKQLPQTKLTGHSTVYLAAPYFGTWDSQAIPRACTAMASTLVDLLSTTTTTTATGVAKPFHRRSRCCRRTRIGTRTAHHHRPLKLTTPTAPGTHGRTPRTLRTEPPIQTSRASDLACQG